MSKLRTRLVYLTMMALLTAAAGATECSNVPPGVDKMFRGADMTKLDLIPFNPKDDDGFKNPVINFTCDQGRMYGQVYQMPDQMWQITKEPAGRLTESVRLYKNSNDLRNRLSADADAMGIIKGFVLSASGSYSKMQATFTTTSRYISEVSSFYSSFRADLKSKKFLQVNEIAKQFADTNLGRKTYESKPKVYQRFIDQYGTHYFSVANFGGHLRAVFETERDFYFSHTDEQVKASARVSFLNLFRGGGGGGSHGSITVDRQFESMSTQTAVHYGGRANLLSPGGIQEWQPTVDDNPWLFSGQLRPIGELLPDPHQRSGMEQAVKQHLMRGYLQELRRLLAAYKPAMSSSSKGKQLKARLDAMEGLALGALDKEKVEALGKDINEEVTVPSWFFKNTQLCYQWIPVDGNGNCKAAGAREVCVRATGSPTTLNSGESGRVCRSHWSLQSKGFDPWFKKVTVCFCSHARGNVAECKRKSKVCVPVNKFSPYLQGNFNCGEGCEMSWKANMPSSAPLWFRTNELCFSWFPQLSSEQKRLCVSTGKWGPYDPFGPLANLNGAAGVNRLYDMLSLAMVIATGLVLRSVA